MCNPAAMEFALPDGKSRAPCADETSSPEHEAATFHGRPPKTRLGRSASIKQQPSRNLPPSMPRAVSLGSSALAPLPVFHPSLQELREAVCLLDASGEGKLWETDFESLLILGFGGQFSESRGWAELKQALACVDGRLSVDAVLLALDSGLFQPLMESQPLAPSLSECEGKLAQCRLACDSGASSGAEDCGGSSPCGSAASSSFAASSVGSLSSTTSRDATCSHSDCTASCCSYTNCGSSSGDEGRGGWRNNGRGSYYENICEYVELFIHFDRDRNGVICAKDLHEALRELTGEVFALEDCKSIIETIDYNDDNVVDLSEFSGMLRLLNFK